MVFLYRYNCNTVEPLESITLWDNDMTCHCNNGFFDRCFALLIYHGACITLSTHKHKGYSTSIRLCVC